MSAPQSALIVDDDRTERRMVARVLKNRLNLEIVEAGSGEECLERLEQNIGNAIKIVVLDLEMPSMNGLDTLKLIVRKYSKFPVIVLTGSTNMDDAVQAMKIGAVDFLAKPASAERIVVSVRNALRLSLMAKEISRLKRQADNMFGFGDLIGHENGLAACVKMGRKAASCDLPVLVTGETGSGKEVFAKAIHGEGSRAGAPFVAINCGAIPEKLVESTLFGHEKGAFTGAVARAAGKFMEADGGTIFLDEVGELSPEAQVKLLRVLQEGEIQPVGAGKSLPVNVRVISATNRDLADDVKRGRFRQDLYFRLNVLHIHLPPLRERVCDIADFAMYFVSAFCAANGSMLREIAPEGLARLRAHEWPGNVRELENVVNRAMTLCEKDRLGAEDFCFGGGLAPGKVVASPYIVMPIGENGQIKPLSVLEQEIIRIALTHHNNNISQTARALGVAKSTLYGKLGAMAGNG